MGEGERETLTLRETHQLSTSCSTPPRAGEPTTNVHGSDKESNPQPFVPWADTLTTEQTGQGTPATFV